MVGHLSDYRSGPCALRLGRFALALAAVERGCGVVALDSSAGAVEVCRRRGLTDVVHASIHRYESGTRFDTFLMMAANLGLLAPDPVRTLQRLRSMANDGAQIVGSTLDPYETEDPQHLAYHEANRERGRLPVMSSSASDVGPPSGNGSTISSRHPTNSRRSLNGVDGRWMSSTMTVFVTSLGSPLRSCKGLAATDGTPP